MASLKLFRSFIKNQQIDKLKKVFLTHGEEESMLEFSQEIQKIGLKEVIVSLISAVNTFFS